MHDTAFEIGSKFLGQHARPGMVVAELGSYDVNGSLRAGCPDGVTYVGLDLSAGPGVDVVVQARKPLPLATSSVDLVVSSSQMEHDPTFWQTFLELARILKPSGRLYLNVPSNGVYHAFPVDVWRFYPDAGRALAQWGTETGMTMVLVESFTSERQADFWNDFVAVFRKDRAPEADEPLLSDTVACTNLRTFRSDALLRPRTLTEDQTIIRDLRDRIAALEAEVHRSHSYIMHLEARQEAAEPAP